MKKVIFTLISGCMLYLGATAQTTGTSACGTSGPSQCTPSGLLTKPGLAPLSDSLPSVINGEVSTTTIQFKNYDTVRHPTFGLVTVSKLRIDTINNLPNGLCWATNKSDNTYDNQEDGCIRVIGTTCADPGVYKLNIAVAVDVGLGIFVPVNAGTVGLAYYVRVKNCGDADVALDTSHHEAFYKPAGYSATASCTPCATGIGEVGSSITTLNVVPNPFNNRAVVNFFSEKSMIVTEKITNMIGNEVLNREIEVKAGSNTLDIDGSKLAAGVYFYTIGSGKSVATKRIVISE